MSEGRGALERRSKDPERAPARAGQTGAPAEGRARRLCRPRASVRSFLILLTLWIWKPAHFRFPTSHLRNGKPLKACLSRIFGLFMSGAALGHLAGIFLIFGGQYGHFGHLGIRARFLCGVLAPDLATFWGLRDDHGHRIWAIWPRIFGWAIWPFWANWPRFCHIPGCVLAFPLALPARHPPAHARHFCSAIVTASSSLYAAHLIIHIVTISAAGFPLRAVRMCSSITLLYL